MMFSFNNQQNQKLQTNTKRREFFKNAGIFSLGCAISSCHAGNINALNTMNENNCLPTVNILVSHHCNLNCAYCDHFSPLAPEYLYPLNLFKKDMEKMYKITKGKVFKIILLGGEPLLNKNIEEFIKISRKHFNNTIIELATNGLLLDKMKDSFWKTCNDNEITIRYSYYPFSDNPLNSKKCIEKADKHNVELIINRPRYCFAPSHLNKNKLKDIEATYENCKCKTKYAILDNGILYPCQIIAGVNLFFNKYFKEQAFKIDKNDYLDIYKISSIDEILEFYKKPKDFCKYCGYRFENMKKLWKTSEKEITEWCDI